jgi:hypothetical protein
MKGRALGFVLAATACAGLTSCTPAIDGAVGVTLDERGRLAAVVAVCAGRQLGWLTLEDHSTGTRTTYTAKRTPSFGEVVTLTGPIDDRGRQGVLDLFDPNDEYTLDGGTARGDEASGRLSGVRFRLRDVLADGRLRQGYVLHGEQGNAVPVTRDEFLNNPPRSSCR